MVAKSEKVAGKPSVMSEIKTNVPVMFKSSMIEGGKRNGARYLIKGVINGFGMAISASEAAGPVRDNALAFLQTPYAEILAKGFLGFFGQNIPQIANSPLAMEFVKECRNQFAEDGQREFLDKVTEYFLPVFLQSFDKVEQLSNSASMFDSLNSSIEQEFAKAASSAKNSK